MKNNILVYNYNEPLPEQGGMERVTDILVSELKKKGLNVYILCSVRNRLGKTYNPPVPIYYLPSSNKAEFLLDLVSDLKIEVIIDQTEGGIVGPFGLFKNRPKALSYVVLLAVQHNSTRDVLRNVKNIFGKKGHTLLQNITTTLYNNTVLKLRYFHFLYHAWRVNRNLDKNYDRTILLSPNFIKDFLHYYPSADKSKLMTIPNPNTYPDDCRLSTHENRVLFVGRLKIDPKGVDKLLRIWQKVEKECNDWILDIVGDGEDRSAMEEYSKKLGLKNVRFHGFKNPEEFYRKASIFCMTSLYEGFGMVLTEAMQHGVIPIAFNSYGAVTDIITHGKSGFLISPFDEDTYASKILALIRTKELRQSMAANALAHSKRFSRETVINQWLNLFETL